MQLFKVIWSFCLGVFDSPFESDAQLPLPVPNHESSQLSTTALPHHITSLPKCREVNRSQDLYGEALIPVLDVQCNTPGNRRGWLPGYDIKTNYEDVNEVPDTGVTRNYILIAENVPWTGDGYLAETMLFNRQYPGPLIEGNWGDTFNITVINNLTNQNGTAIHWHGIRQFNNSWADGVPGVTQCPIAPRQQMTYTFKATQYGTSWYHSHFSLQYGDGLAGPMVIHGPTSADYDEDLGVFMISDWYHSSAFSANYRQAPPPISKLVNGRGNYTVPSGFVWANQTFFEATRACDPETDLKCYPTQAKTFSAQKLKRGKKYKLHIINSSVDTHYTWWVEGHKVRVVAADFVPVKPYTLEPKGILNIGIGQRYDVIIELKEESLQSHQTDFWINLRNCDRRCIGSPFKWTPDFECPMLDRGTKKPICNLAKQWAECRQAFLRYDVADNDRLPSREGLVVDPGSQDCQDEPLLLLEPEVDKEIPPMFIDVEKTSTIGLTMYDDWDTYGNTFFHWMVHRDTFKLNWTNPTLSILGEGKKVEDPHYSAFEVPANRKWMVLIVDGNYIVKNPEHEEIPDHNRINHRPVGGKHPIHLHGHDFMVLAQEEAPKNKTMPKPTPEEMIAKVKENVKAMKARNSTMPRRDTALLPDGGYLVLAWKNDNPGPWLMHCHIAWHVSNGFALQFIEREPEIIKDVKAIGKWKQYEDRCQDWNIFAKHTWVESHDSGV
ncbi:Laccase-2 [Dactylellina cionopaga]|nr:Laccase-2 [Dactylellina cionopaga]